MASVLVVHRSGLAGAPAHRKGGATCGAVTMSARISQASLLAMRMGCRGAVTIRVSQ